jgi:lysophospholipase L1-like esterase
LQPAVLNLLQTTRAALRNTIIVVLGVWHGNSASADRISKENKISAAVTQFNDSKTVFAPTLTATPEAWVTGTGKVGATTGTGNSDIVTGSDGTHPSDYGHKYIGIRTAEAIREALKTIEANL